MHRCSVHSLQSLFQTKKTWKGDLNVEELEEHVRTSKTAIDVQIIFNHTVFRAGSLPYEGKIAVATNEGQCLFAETHAVLICTVKLREKNVGVPVNPNVKCRELAD